MVSVVTAVREKRMGYEREVKEFPADDFVAAEHEAAESAPRSVVVEPNLDRNVPAGVPTPLK